MCVVVRVTLLSHAHYPHLEKLNIYSADYYYSYCRIKCVNLIYERLSKKLLCLVFVSYVLAASGANMCGRKQLLLHSNHVSVI
jgi:hypothetical protein